MIPSDQIARTFQSNAAVGRRQLEGLTHEESLQTPGFNANPLNWILGHIVNGRNEALSYLDRPGIFSEDESERYRTGSERIRPETALELSELTARLDAAQADLEAALAAVTEEFLQEVVPTRFGDRPRWQHLSGLAWHETYHVGQLELLRQFVLDERSEN